MDIRTSFGLALAALSLAACGVFSDHSKEVPDGISPTESSVTCPVLESKNLKAWINAMPGTTEPTLNISGEIVLPTGGYTVGVRPGPLDRRQPPTQRVILDLVKPDGAALQALTTETVSGQLSDALPAYRAVVVVCGDTTLAEITDIETAY